MKSLMYISKHAEATIDISIPDGSGYEPCNFEIFLFPSCTENEVFPLRKIFLRTRNLQSALHSWFVIVKNKFCFTCGES